MKEKGEREGGIGLLLNLVILTKEKDSLFRRLI